MAGLVFRALGYRTSVAGGAEEALAAVTAGQPDVILCEVEVPGADGVELTRRIRQSRAGKRARVILIGEGDEPAGNAADEYLRQPFDPMQALELLEAQAGT